MRRQLPVIDNSPRIQARAGALWNGVDVPSVEVYEVGKGEVSRRP